MVGQLSLFRGHVKDRRPVTAVNLTLASELVLRKDAVMISALFSVYLSNLQSKTDARVEIWCTLCSVYRTAQNIVYKH
jgi:hypothetical protein